MQDYKNDIDRYLRGELTASEMHALEKKALQDPFLAEALEGAHHAGPDHFSVDIEILHQSIRKKTHKGKSRIISFNVRNYAMGIAAGLSLIVVSYFVIVSILDQQHRHELASNKEIPAPAEESSGRDTTRTPAGNQLSLNDEVLPSQQSKPVIEKDIKPDAAKPSAREPIAENEIAGLRPDAEKDDGIETAAQQGRDERIAAAEEAEVAETFDKPLPSPAQKEVSGAPSTAAYKGESESRKKTKSDVTARAYAEKKAEALVTGQVVSAEDGAPIPGVNVLIKGTSIGTVTDNEGKYQLPVNDLNETLAFNYIGMQNQEIRLNNALEANVQMLPDHQQLSEVVVTGYGEYSKARSVTRLAEPSTGRNAFQQYLKDNVKYPQQAIDRKTEGRVTIQFTVNPDGHLSDFKVIRGIGQGCDEELIRLIRQGPSWTPTQKDNQPITDMVRVRFKFELPEK